MTIDWTDNEAVVKACHPEAHHWKNWMMDGEYVVNASTKDNNLELGRGETKKGAYARARQHYTVVAFEQTHSVVRAKLWVLVADYNDYRQHGEYFIAAWVTRKPTLEQLKAAMGGSHDREVLRVFEGRPRDGHSHGGDVEYSLSEIEEGIYSKVEQSSVYSMWRHLNGTR